MVNSDKNRLTVLQIFNNPIRYEVPSFYQRPYVWTREKQWDELWEDIRRKTEELLETSGDSENGEQDEDLDISNHFFGAFVVRPYVQYGFGPQRKDVIDGQQRLTTLQIILLAFEHTASDLIGADHQVSKSIRFLVENPNCEPSDDWRFKIWPTETDRNVFSKIFGTLNRAEVETALSNTGQPDNVKCALNEEKGIDGAYIYFSNCIRNFLTSESDGDQIPIAETERRIRKLYEVVAQRMDLVIIELGSTDDPQVIFEALNGRGTPLLPSDLIKNFVFERARQTAKVKDPMPLYSKYWSHFDSAEDISSKPDDEAAPAKFWKVEVRQGRLFRPRIDLFLFHFLQYRKGKEIPITELFKQFKIWWKDQNSSSKNEFEAVLSDIQRHSETFKHIMVPDPKQTPVSNSLRRLRAMDTSTIFPVLLFLCAEAEKPTGKTNLSDLPQLLLDIESYLVRRSICGLTAKNYNSLFLKVLSALRAMPDLNRNSVATVLMNETGASTYFPKDDEFHRAWVSRPVYASSKAVFISMLLSAIDVSMKKQGEEQHTFDYDSLWIEHIMPRRWQANWRLDNPDAEHHKDIATNESISNREWREDLLHTIGNLTLLTAKLNDRISNGPFYDPKSRTDKFREIRDHSRLRLNDCLAETTVWDENAIAGRAEDLYRIAVKIWPYPMIAQAAQ